MSRKRRPPAPELDPLQEAEPLLPIARALKESIDAKLVGEASVLDVDAAWNAAVASVAERLIAERLQGVDPQTVLRWYAQAVGDETLKEKLGAWAAARVAELERHERLERLRAEVRRTGAVELATLEPDTHLAIGMFEPR